MKLITRYAFEKDLTTWKDLIVFDDGKADDVTIFYDIYKGSINNKSHVKRSIINKRSGRACTSKEEALARYHAIKGL